MQSDWQSMQDEDGASASRSEQRDPRERVGVRGLLKALLVRLLGGRSGSGQRQKKRTGESERWAERAYRPPCGGEDELFEPLAYQHLEPSVVEEDELLPEETVPPEHPPDREKLIEDWIEDLLDQAAKESRAAPSNALEGQGPRSEEDDLTVDDEGFLSAETEDEDDISLEEPEQVDAEDDDGGEADLDPLEEPDADQDDDGVDDGDAGFDDDGGDVDVDAGDE